MLEVMGRGHVYSLFPFKGDKWIFFAFDASTKVDDRKAYAVTLPRDSLKALIDLERWFSNPIWDESDLDLVTNPKYHDFLKLLLLDSMSRARFFAGAEVCHHKPGKGCPTAEASTKSIHQEVRSGQIALQVK